MEKIFYNEDGWVCEREPHRFEIEDVDRYIEVEEEIAAQTYCTCDGYAWRVVNGELVNEIFDQGVISEQTTRDEIAEIESWFTNVYDAQVKQYNRCQRLGVKYDNKYGTIEELDTLADIQAKRITELKKQINNS